MTVETLARIPLGMDDATAAAIPTAGLTGTQIVDDVLQVAAGQRILVTGATGAVGRFALFAVQARGATAVAAVRPTQRDAALTLGAAAVIELGGARDGSTGAPFDHIVDTVGRQELAALCHRLRPGGRIITAATLPIPLAALPAALETFAVRPDGVRLARLAEAVAAGRIAVPIADRLSLDRAADAPRRVDAGGAGGKIVLMP